MQIVAVVLGVLSVAHSVNAFGLGAVGGGGGGCCPAAPACPPPPPPCAPPPAPACPQAPACPAPPPVPQVFCPSPPACILCAPPPPPNCPQIAYPPPPSCPAPQPCQVQAPACSQSGPQSNQNDCCHRCGQSCRFKSRKAFGLLLNDRNVDPHVQQPVTTRHHDERAFPNCLEIFRICRGSMSDSKRAIQKSAELKFEAKFNVICSTGAFAYVVNSALFCQTTLEDVTCYAFKH